MACSRYISNYLFLSALRKIARLESHNAQIFRHSKKFKLLFCFISFLGYSGHMKSYLMIRFLTYTKIFKLLKLWFISFLISLVVAFLFPTYMLLTLTCKCNVTNVAYLYVYSRPYFFEGFTLFYLLIFTE